jgi:5'-nucleotidase
MTAQRRLLLTNDDGIDAPGLAALEAAIAGLGMPKVVAPLGAQSGASHKVTTDAAVPIDERGPDRFAVDGTPADCVRLALHHIAGPVDWVLAGINAGGNLGVDIHHSGTVAAVREGVIHGLRGVAVSHFMAKGRSIDWNRAARWTRQALNLLLARPAPPETFWNVNLPHPRPEVEEVDFVFCPVDPSPLPLSYRVDGAGAEYIGSYPDRPRRPGWDVEVCLGGRVAISLVHLMASVERFDGDGQGLPAGRGGTA